MSMAMYVISFVHVWMFQGEYAKLDYAISLVLQWLERAFERASSLFLISIYGLLISHFCMIIM